MGSWHVVNLAFVWHSPAAVQALMKILRPSRPFASVVKWRALGVNGQPDQDLLCVATENIVPSADIVDAIRAVDVSALSAVFECERQRDILATFGSDSLTDDKAAKIPPR